MYLLSVVDSSMLIRLNLFESVPENALKSSEKGGYETYVRNRSARCCGVSQRAEWKIEVL